MSPGRTLLTHCGQVAAGGAAPRRTVPLTRHTRAGETTHAALGPRIYSAGRKFTPSQSFYLSRLQL